MEKFLSILQIYNAFVSHRYPIWEDDLPAFVISICFIQLAESSHYTNEDAEVDSW